MDDCVEDGGRFQVIHSDDTLDTGLCAKVHALRQKINHEGLPQHGGDLDWACKTFAREKGDWIDMSTGVSPWTWPVPEIPESVWQSLPGSHKGLLEIASRYYGCALDRIAPIPGSQYAISRVPKFVPRGRVALPELGYQEHRLAWEKHGHVAEYYRDLGSLEAIVQSGQVEYVVVINPNNPGGERASSNYIAHISKILGLIHSDGLLLVDEAFMDSTPDQSSISLEAANVLVLRSVGKFFGLAGLRLGFVIGSRRWCEIFEREISPWLISHPALYIGEKALSDDSWIALQKQRIDGGVRMLSALLSTRYQSPIESELFVTVSGEAEILLDDFIGLGLQGVLTRFVRSSENDGLLRFGLPGDRIQIFLDRLKLLC